MIALCTIIQFADLQRSSLVLRGEPSRAVFRASPILYCLSKLSIFQDFCSILLIMASALSASTNSSCHPSPPLSLSLSLICFTVIVSYGNWKRREETYSPESDTAGTSESYMPTIFPVSSNFDGGCEHPCGYGEKRESESWNSGYFVGNARPSRLRPLSVDETQYESMKTRSSTQTSSMSSSPKEDSFTHSMSSEVLNSKVENVKKRKSPHSQGSSSPSGFASSPPKPMNEKASVSALHLRGYSIGSFHEEDLRRSSENYLKDLSGSGSRSGSGNGSGSEEEQLGSKELGQGFLGLNTKPASLTKSASRGKSVRTIRGSKFATHEKVEKMCDIGEFISMRKDMMQNGVTNMKDLGNGKSKHDLGNPFHMPKLEFPKHEKKEMREVRGNAAAESEEEEPESEAENFQLSSDDEREDDALAAAAAATSSNSLNVGGADSEVDKKAGEFIAKFREQIRLQKVASKDRSRGQHISANSFGR